MWYFVYGGINPTSRPYDEKIILTYVLAHDWICSRCTSTWVSITHDEGKPQGFCDKCGTGNHAHRLHTRYAHPQIEKISAKDAEEIT